MTPTHRVRTRSERLLLVAALALLAPGPPKKETPLPALNQQVVEFSRQQLGKKVGDGNCLTLAIAALTHAGARRFPLDDPKGDYAWGTEIKNSKDALPGDILQFRDAVFKGRKALSRRRWYSWKYTYPHHTAVVSDVREGGKVLVVLHQNVGGEGVDESAKKLVQEGTLRMDSLQPGGWVRIYRPVERFPSRSRDADEANARSADADGGS